MSSPPRSLPPAASPVTTPPPLTPSFPPLLPPLLPSPFPQPLMPPLPQIAPSSPTSTPPTLPPINNSDPPVSSPPPPPLTSPPPQLPPLPVLLPPSTVTPPPTPSATSPPPPTLVTSSPPSHSPPPSVVTSSPPPPSPPLTPLPSTPSLPPLSPPLPPPHVSPPIIPSTAPPPPALSTPTPPAPTSPTTQTPPLASPTNDSPPPALPPPLASTLQPSPSNNNSIIPPPTTLTMPPQSMLHPPLSSSLPTTLQVHNPRANKSTAFIAGSCAVGGLVAVALFLAILFLCCNRRRSKNNSALLADPHKTPPFATKDVRLPGVHVIRVLSSSNVPQSPISRNAGSASIKSRYQFPHPPQTQRPAGSPFDFSNGIFTYDQIVVATNGFSEANLLGQGGFGYVHKGVLPSGKEVAVKQLKTGSRQGEREFQSEVDIISRVHHKHLVSLVGYCTTGVDRLLVYEFVPNNTLEFHLHGEGQPVLEWEIRLRIATGSAKGLAYLHEDCNPKIIHRDIKASNILLDHNFEAKVSDFGLAKSFSDTNTHMTHFSTRVVGTFGYLAPEYASSGKVTDKSDVYSYGVVLLELITGRRPISTSESIRNKGLVQWARPLLTQALEDGDFDALTDPRLEKNYKKNEMARIVACAAACVRHSAWLRPRMSQVVHALEGVASLTELREGITPGNSTLHNGFENAYLDISRYSETTSGYGLNPSGSSSEGQRTVWS